MMTTTTKTIAAVIELDSRKGLAEGYANAILNIAPDATFVLRTGRGYHGKDEVQVLAGGQDIARIMPSGSIDLTIDYADYVAAHVAEFGMKVTARTWKDGVTRYGVHVTDRTGSAGRRESVETCTCCHSTICYLA